MLMEKIWGKEIDRERGERGRERDIKSKFWGGLPSLSSSGDGSFSEEDSMTSYSIPLSGSIKILLCEGEERKRVERREGDRGK